MAGQGPPWTSGVRTPRRGQICVRINFGLACLNAGDGWNFAEVRPLRRSTVAIGKPHSGFNPARAVSCFIVDASTIRWPIDTSSGAVLCFNNRPMLNNLNGPAVLMAPARLGYRMAPGVARHCFARVPRRWCCAITMTVPLGPPDEGVNSGELGNTRPGLVRRQPPACQKTLSSATTDAQRRGSRGAHHQRMILLSRRTQDWLRGRASPGH